MKLGTSVSLFLHDPAGGTVSTVESLRRCAKAGFQVVDMNFHPMLSGKTEFVRDDWEKSAYEIRAAAEQLGLVFSQAHLPYHANYMKQNLPGDASYNERFDEYMRRSILSCGILGVKWAVGHSFCNYDEDIYDDEADIKLNHELYEPIIEALKKQGTGLAFENIAGVQKPIRRRFTAAAEELCALADSFHDSGVGVCWDFGHGNRFYKDMTHPLRIIGSRLKATHVNDNMGQLDSHTLPFVCGNAAWAPLMPVLSEINYTGDFVYELKFGNTLPDELKDDYAKLAFEIGSYCLTLVRGETK